MTDTAYCDYATCTWCGFKKYCRLDREKRAFVCKACEGKFKEKGK
jgi:hypothetical protein